MVLDAIGGALGGRFGTVGKAMFKIGKKQKDDGEWEYSDPVMVLINPSEIRVSSSTHTKKEEGVANEATEPEQRADGKITPKGITEQSVEMKLIFNVVEAYELLTAGSTATALVQAAASAVSSLIGGTFGEDKGDILDQLMKNTDLTGFSIMNPEMCCYYPLLKAAHKQKPVLFSWGNLAFGGLITKFQTSFNYFSPQGAPLGAEVTLSMTCAVNDKIMKKTETPDTLMGMVSKGGKKLRLLP